MADGTKASTKVSFVSPLFPVISNYSTLLLKNVIIKKKKTQRYRCLNCKISLFSLNRVLYETLSYNTKRTKRYSNEKEVPHSSVF